MADQLLPTPGVLDELHRAVARAAADLERLAAERRRLIVLGDHWRGGHRLRFDELLAALDRRHADVDEALAAARLALRRASDEGSR